MKHAHSNGAIRDLLSPFQPGLTSGVMLSSSRWNSSLAVVTSSWYWATILASDCAAWTCNKPKWEGFNIEKGSIQNLKPCPELVGNAIYQPSHKHTLLLLLLNLTLNSSWNQTGRTSCPQKGLTPIKLPGDSFRREFKLSQRSCYGRLQRVQSALRHSYSWNWTELINLPQRMWGGETCTSCQALTVCGSITFFTTLSKSTIIWRRFSSAEVMWDLAPAIWDFLASSITPFIFSNSSLKREAAANDK